MIKESDDVARVSKKDEANTLVGLSSPSLHDWHPGVACCCICRIAFLGAFGGFVLSQRLSIQEGSQPAFTAHNNPAGMLRFTQPAFYRMSLLSTGIY